MCASLCGWYAQSAFVLGRLINDNIMAAFELNYSMWQRTNGEDGFISLKLDMTKANDRVEWDFWVGMMKANDNINLYMQQVPQCGLGMDGNIENKKYLGISCFMGINKRQSFDFLRAKIEK